MRALLLAFIFAYALSNEIAPQPALAPFIGTAMLVWLLLEFSKMALVAQVTAAAALLLAALSWANGTLDGDILVKAVGRAAFFTWFILSMDLLRAAAQRSRMVRETGRVLVEQPPGRRYLMLTFGSHFFALLMNLGTVTLLGTVTRAATEGARDARVAEIRLQRMSVAIVRGFAAGTLWLPTSITVQVVVTTIPDFQWHDLAAQGAATAIAFMGLGWLIDRLDHPIRPPGTFAHTLASTLAKLVPLVMLTIGMLLVATGLTAVSGLRPIAGLLCVVPCFGLAWLAMQKRGAGLVTVPRLWARVLQRQVLPELATLRSEVAILTSAGFIAVLLPRQVDTLALAALIGDHHLAGAMLLVPMLWLLAAAAPFGLNPIVSVAACLEIVVNLPGVDLPAPALALAATVAWCMASGMSPLGATIRIMARCIGRPPVRIGLSWNGPYTLWIGLAATGVLFVIS